MSGADPQSFFQRSEQDPAHLIIRGDWVLAHYAELREQIGLSQGRTTTARSADLSDLAKLDTAGAQLLAELLGPELLSTLAERNDGIDPKQGMLLQRVAQTIESSPPQSATQGFLIVDLLARIGDATLTFWHHLVDLLGFTGLVLASLSRNILRPSNWRITSLVAQIEVTGLNALPIVALLTFMVGAVVAFLGATILESFGATIYTVDLVAFSFMREFGVLLTAILLAGRTASAFTAQIGSMKANEEVDAIRALGLNPIDLLVLPRVLAMLISLPILTLVAMFSGLLGGALVCMLSLDISPTMFLGTLQQNMDVQHFYVGMVKAPIFAFLIALIGCLEGFKVTGSAQSVGEHTTSSVVQSIFVVILVDALAALFFMEMGW
ncbi:MlaE family ABC transporter permease [Halopseudomonas salina]|uniref:ABC transporter permease n=1 Tax=Halopseudomonas salina TaxID=1323744 RepID=A0ABQ1PWF4_9GAMM|nr:ABC transporter permease [Halopseudomonas salina]GGD05375.1 ABC transporter permease [Halopseudomonas salina]